MTWGRFNPPHLGHTKLIEAVLVVGIFLSADTAVFISKTEGPEDPLPYDKKVAYLKQAFGSVIKDIPVTNVIALLKTLPYDDVIMIVGSDRVEQFRTLLSKYNGTEFSFKTTRVISAGERTEYPISASKMREYARQDDFETFSKSVPVGINAHALWTDVRQGLRLGRSRTTRRSNQTTP